MKNAIIIMFLFCAISYSQISSSPSPTIGWDSLKLLLKYPELARRAGIEGIAMVTISLSSTGEILSLDVSSDAPIINDGIEKVLQRTTWIPAVKNGHTVRSTMRFPIYFLLTDDYEGRCIIIKAKPANVMH